MGRKSHLTALCANCHLLNVFLKQNKQVMEEKEKEFLKIEQQSLPVRQYLMKYVLPKVTDAFLEITRLRPEDPVKSIGNYLFQGLFGESTRKRN
jgi:hypothetical protein